MTDGFALTRAGLVAPEGNTRWYEGAGVLETAMGIRDGFKDRDAFTIGANTVVGGLSAIGAVMDPFQMIFSAGVGWLMEHVSILREPLDWLAGDPKKIEGHAMTWHNVEQRIREAAEYFVDQVETSTARWSSAAAAAYRIRAREHAEDVQALGALSGVLAESTLVAGAMVGVVRNTVRDVIAEVVGAAVSKAIQAALVVTIPKVVAEVSILVAKCATKILTLLKKLMAVVAEIGERIKHAQGLLAKVNASLRRASDDVLILDMTRLEATDLTVGRTIGPDSYRMALGPVGQGHQAVHGTAAQIAERALKNASRNNGIQNTGTTADKLRDEEDPGPPPLVLPL